MALKEGAKMKYVGIKIVSLTLALVLLIELCPVLVLADLVSEWEKSYKINEARYQYSSNQADNGENREDGFHWCGYIFTEYGIITHTEIMLNCDELPERIKKTLVIKENQSS